MWVWLAINRHSCPAVGNDFDVGGSDVWVGFHKVSAENTGKELGRSDRVLLGLNVDGIFH